jgi:hypothetical protein
MIRIYTAECYWPGVTEAKLREAGARASHAAEALSREGTLVRYLGSVLFPGDEVVLFEFDGASPEAVRRASERAELSVERIIEALRIQGSNSSAATAPQPPS